MGCDIHMIGQVRSEDIWEDFPIAPYFTGRFYNFFAVLANVRNPGHIEPISEPKGLPKGFPPDHPELSQEHSQSWLALAELKAYKLRKIDGEYPVEKDFWDDFIRYLEFWKGYGDTDCDIRIVFDFDS